MAKILTISTFVTALFLSSLASASSGLVVHTAEFGVGKFHRYDNQVHAYDRSSAWTPYVLPAQAPTEAPLVVSNEDGSVTVFFSTLDDLISSVTQVSLDRHQPIAVLNVHGHGLPGSMWFPKDNAALHDWPCANWRDAASGSDQGNYEQYYSAVSISEIREIRQISDSPSVQQGCTTGLSEWREGVAKEPRFKAAFAPDAQIHFLSCVVGMGSVGQSFTQGIAQLLLTPQGKGKVETSVDFGLGDWSMPEGMGFWDLQSEAQVDHDMQIYGMDRKDREIAQKGTIRRATYGISAWESSLLANRDFLSLKFDLDLETGLASPQGKSLSLSGITSPLPFRIRVPGTAGYVYLK